MSSQFDVILENVCKSGFDIHEKVEELCSLINIEYKKSIIDDEKVLNAIVDRCSAEFSKYNKSQEIAGEILIWSHVNRLPNFEDYYFINECVFNDQVKTLFYNYKEILNEFCEKYKSVNYYNKDYFSAKSMIKNYFMRPIKANHATETPLYMALRIGAQLYPESIDKVMRFALEMSLSFYVPSSPTIFNSGLKKHQLSSCFLLQIDDTMKDILETVFKDSAMISSMGGGVGFSLSSIRNSDISNVGTSNGIMPIARVADYIAVFANQSGRRKGAFTLFLNIYHIDVLDFIKSTDNFGIDHAMRLSTANTCLWVNDLFYLVP